MTNTAPVAAHYGREGLLAAFEAGVAALGKSPATVSIDDLAPADEFHIGRREASIEFLDQLGLAAGQRVLDVGCGLGGPARFAADRYRVLVRGVDLTPAYVEAGKALTRWTALDGAVDLQVADATSLPFDDGSFDAAYMIHVGMNIADKRALFGEVARVLRRDAPFGIYDVMRAGGGALAYPLPWATSAATCAVATPAAYREALEATGFLLIAERVRRQFALDFFARLRARLASSKGPPPLGLHLVMGADTVTKIGNMAASIEGGLIAPVEMIARRR
ncbi:class I SAM-dependent methyltransferase [Zeimonas arvi]|uniref:Methyltransferase domain-containing protein n=1 Tax=Zeimonas arvi TaxID=2498847 RepID=A0A5C8P174_9BURK|nr:methyltransferase domain-containing protein [Zeimonas arvi]TXL67062.1 methyltransferase domain-containing protein [Zeimonas arvi]